jgi:hypothetical protein
MPSTVNRTVRRGKAAASSWPDRCCEARRENRISRTKPVDAVPNQTTFSTPGPQRPLLLAGLCLSLAATACQRPPEDETNVTAQSASAAAGPRAAKPPAALPHDERTSSPMVANRPPQQLQRLSDDLPTNREHLAARGLLSQQDLASKLPKQPPREPSTRRALADTIKAPADLADRYRRYQAEAKALEASADPSETAEQRAQHRDDLKRAIVIEGKR